jgi:ATP-dependent RNA helicase DeaD
MSSKRSSESRPTPKPDLDHENVLVPEPSADLDASSATGFGALGLHPSSLRFLHQKQLSQPTDVQDQVIPQLLRQSTDLVALAPTGTGKTLAFGLPMIEKLARGERRPQALVLCPTRELCVQVAEQLTGLAQMHRMSVISIYGGDGYRRQLDGLRSGAAIVVATPGRLIDLLERKQVDLSGLKVLVLDEADEMISVGFREALDTILTFVTSQEDSDELASTPEAKIQTWLFSATMSADIRDVCSKYIKSPVTVDARKAITKPQIDLQAMLTFEEDRLEALCRYLHAHDDFYGLIFCRTKAAVVELEESLRAEGFDVESLHGDKAQAERERVLAAWKAQRVKIVVATDVAARGLDVAGLTHVVNMGLATELETFVHRIGRTGRAGKSGVALNFVGPRDLPRLRLIEQRLKTKVSFIDVPSDSQVAQALVRGELKRWLSVEGQSKSASALAQVREVLDTVLFDMKRELQPEARSILAEVLTQRLHNRWARPSVRRLNPEAPRGASRSRPPIGGRMGRFQKGHGSFPAPRLAAPKPVERRGSSEVSSSGPRPSRGGPRPVGPKPRPSSRPTRH